MIAAGSKTKAPRIATGGRCGRWRCAAPRTATRRDELGQRLFSGQHCPLSKHSHRLARGHSRCLRWMLFARWWIATLQPSAFAAILADRLMSLLSTKKPIGWYWFEDVLAYDNARLPQALIQTGVTTGSAKHIAAGLQSLRWLMSQQTASSGHFRPVGSESFGRRYRAPEAFDQQPVEAAATISACLAAARVDRELDWAQTAMSGVRLVSWQE